MQKKISPYIVWICLICACSTGGWAQLFRSPFFKPSDSLDKTRLYSVTGFIGASYSVFSVGLYHAWYKKQGLSAFHFYNDWKEWSHMDKCGHLYDGYFQSSYVYDLMRWTGMRRGHSVLASSAVSMLFLSSLELFDGLSPKWGFSWSDMAANSLGVATFAAQQWIWNEQKILLKFSSFPKSYKDQGWLIQQRAEELYGSGPAEKILKDYNAQTYWISFSPSIFKNTASTWWPSFLNVAIGYGADGMYGGYENRWKSKEGIELRLDPRQYPRLKQYYLSLDLDLRKIRTKSSFLNALLRGLTIFKIPAPAIELNSLGRFKFYPLHY